jgi:hypothetical protein
MLLFRSEQHVERWCSQWARPRGDTLSLAQGWNLAKLWYGDRLSAEWKAKSIEQAESTFAEVGLVGEFWRLR